MAKATYKIKNWKEYNRALVNRGNLTVWVDEETISKWESGEKTGRKGRSNFYSDVAIECALTVRGLLRFPLRQTQGFFEGLFKMLDLGLDVPTYSTLSRRAAALNIDIPKIDWSRPVNVLIDGSGLKVFGEADEFAEISSPLAKNFPLSSFNPEGISKGRDLKTPLFLLCRSRRRSMKAAEILASRGFESLYNVEGGMIEWEASGLPVVKG